MGGNQSSRRQNDMNREHANQTEKTKVKTKTKDSTAVSWQCSFLDHVKQKHLKDRPEKHKSVQNNLKAMFTMKSILKHQFYTHFYITKTICHFLLFSDCRYGGQQWPCKIQVQPCICLYLFHRDQVISNSAKECS